jgi:hypothetical protein
MRLILLATLFSVGLTASVQVVAGHGSGLPGPCVSREF